jgi:hypothetical protein
MRVKRRSFTMLEVIIACGLILLCFLPLMAPHLEIVRAQATFNRKITLDEKVNLLYAAVIQKLYSNKIEWSELESKSEFRLDSLTEFETVDISPYQGYYEFYSTPIVCRPKKKKQAPYRVYLLTLTFHFFLPNKTKSTQQEEELKYVYKIFAVRDLTATQPLEDPKNKNKKEEELGSKTPKSSVKKHGQGGG